MTKKPDFSDLQKIADQLTDQISENLSKNSTRSRSDLSSSPTPVNTKISGSKNDDFDSSTGEIDSQDHSIDSPGLKENQGSTIQGVKKKNNQTDSLDKSHLLLQAEKELQIEMERASKAHKRTTVLLKMASFIFILTILIWLYLSLADIQNS